MNQANVDRFWNVTCIFSIKVLFSFKGISKNVFLSIHFAHLPTNIYFCMTGIFGFMLNLLLEF